MPFSCSGNTGNDSGHFTYSLLKSFNLPMNDINGKVMNFIMVITNMLRFGWFEVHKSVEF